MKICVTGGAGFIGSHMTERLLQRGDDVVVLDNYETGRRDNLLEHERLRVVEGSVADAALVSSLFDEFRPDVVVHAAASYKDPDNWHGDIVTNALGSAIVARAAATAGCGRIVYFQTALCYGTRPTEQPVTLGHHLDPDSSYAISKTAGEHYIRHAGLDWVSFRLANVYGPRNLSGPLPTFYRRLADGEPCFVADTRRDFLYIDDLVALVIPAIDGRGHGVYHGSSGGDVAIKELYDETVRALGVRVETPVDVRKRSPDDASTILLDPTRTVADFAWTPTTPLRDGIDRAISYYREFGVEQTFTHLHLPAARRSLR